MHIIPFVIKSVCILRNLPPDVVYLEDKLVENRGKLVEAYPPLVEGREQLFHLATLGMILARGDDLRSGDDCLAARGAHGSHATCTARALACNISGRGLLGCSLLFGFTEEDTYLTGLGGSSGLLHGLGCRYTAVIGSK